MLAIAANSDDAFWLIGGVDLQLNAAGRSERVYLDDAYCYRPGEGWTAIAKLPHPIAASPSPAPVKDGKILIIGGDDGAQVGHDPRIHRGFNQQILTYDPTTQRWSEQGRVTEPTVTVPCVSWSHTELNESTWLVTSGEVRPAFARPVCEPSRSIPRIDACHHSILIPHRREALQPPVGSWSSC